ncbi:MAG: hypothetical protein IJF08_04520 [Clostridia bacterium]|nr:hypothetical protein [Clostridia bacterium]
MSEQFLILDAIGQIDDAYLEQYFVMKQAFAKKAQKGKRARTWIALSAACLVLAVALTIGTALNGRYDQPVYLENGKIDISSLPGAQVVQTDENCFSSVVGDVYSPDGYIAMAQKTTSIMLYGTAQNVQTVKIEEANGRVWYITTFELVVIEAVKHCEDGQILTVVSVNCGEPEWDFRWSSNIDIINQPTGFFHLRTNKKEDTWNMNSQEYAISEFGDYYAMSEFECDGEYMIYYRMPISLDELKGSGD